MARATEAWLRAYESKGIHPKAIKAMSNANDYNLESELHDDIIKFLNQHDIPYYHSRMDRKTTGNVGAPDFFIFLDKGRTLHIECKRKDNKPSVEQLAYHAWLRKKDHPVFVVRTMAEFIEAYESSKEAAS